MKQKTIYWGILYVFGMLFFIPSIAVAQTFCQDNTSGAINRPASGYGVTSNTGYRDTGIQGASKWHKGTDYATPCGTRISGPPAGCVNIEGGSSTSQRGGYGYTAKFDCGNGIQIQYAHLESANSYSPTANTIATGNSGVGGCHLDYIVTIDDKVVDAQCATGNSLGNYTYGRSSSRHNKKCPNNGPANLCDPSTREALKQHSDQLFSGSGGRNNYSIKDGATLGGGNNTSDEGSNETDEGTTFFLGTGNIGRDVGNVNEEVPDSDVENNPEEEENEADDPADEYDQETSTPRCKNSTCITKKMISTANNDQVEWKRVEANTALIELPKDDEEIECIDPRPTGFDVRKQIPGDRITYEDAFCIQQGCTYVREGDEGKCVK